MYTVQCVTQSCYRYGRWSSGLGWWWQVHAQGARRGLQLHVCVCQGGLVPVVCFTASSWSNMIISQAAVVWQTRQIHRGSPQNGPRSSTATFCCVRWEKQRRYGMRAKVPLRAIKYSSAIRHQALGSIPTESCIKPPRILLPKTTTEKSQIQKAEQKKVLSLFFDLTTGNTDLYKDEQKEEKIYNHLVHRVQQQLFNSFMNYSSDG